MTWADVCAHPSLRDLPFTIEQDRYGRLLMSPTSLRHGRRQAALFRLLEGALRGEAVTECAVHTAGGVRVPDVVWMSDVFAEALDPEVFALDRAPEICAEVMSPSNLWGEMDEKIVLYLAAGAQEVWICQPDGRLRWFGHEGERERSAMVPDAPPTVDV